MATRLEVLVVDDEPAIREVLSLRISDWGHAVRAVGDATDAIREIDTRSPHLVLCDVLLPGSSGLAVLHRIRERDARIPVVMITAHATIDTAVEAMKSGATDFLTKPLEWDAVRAMVAGVERSVRERHNLASMNAQLDRMTTSADAGAIGLVGESRAIRDLVRTVQAVASSDASAIITGESGTGKEVVARAIHTLGTRRSHPFVGINAA